jgi:hypothetical protein
MDRHTSCSTPTPARTTKPCSAWKRGRQQWTVRLLGFQQGSCWHRCSARCLTWRHQRSKPNSLNQYLQQQRQWGQTITGADNCMRQAAFDCYLPVNAACSTICGTARLALGAALHMQGTSAVFSKVRDVF